MAIAQLVKVLSRQNDEQVQVHSQASTANASQTCSTPTGQIRWLYQVTAAYSAAPTQTGVTVTINSGVGAAYDCTLSTGTANTRYSTFIPERPILLLPDDVIDVVAPAGGAGITSAAAARSSGT